MLRRTSKSMLCSLALVLCSHPGLADSPSFESEILPILQRSCYECHGPTEAKSSYRLDIRETAFRGGDSRQAGIVPHDSAASELIRRITHEDSTERMPPADSEGPPLSGAEIQLLKDWIDAGPEWPDTFAGDTTDGGDHWSLNPLVKPDVPHGTDHPIDAFIHARLEAEGVAPSPPADKRTLVRRLYTDLVGLPPTPEAVDAFVADKAPNAYENLVRPTLALATPRRTLGAALARYRSFRGHARLRARPRPRSRLALPRLCHCCLQQRYALTPDSSASSLPPTTFTRKKRNSRPRSVFWAPGISISARTSRRA